MPSLVLVRRVLHLTHNPKTANSWRSPSWAVAGPSGPSLGRRKSPDNEKRR
jgi:hypothetical protein